MTTEKKITNKKPVEKAKKIKKVREGRGAINGYFSFNNTILSLSKENGEVLTQCSAGSMGYRGTKKSTAYVKELLNMVSIVSNYKSKVLEQVVTQ
jgi:small subunit ribosomal protein S11